MRSALRVFTRELFGFAETILAVALVYFLAAIALLNSFALGRTNEQNRVATGSSSPHRKIARR
jgi:hypothetical protein